MTRRPILAERCRSLAGRAVVLALAAVTACSAVTPAPISPPATSRDLVAPSESNRLRAYETTPCPFPVPDTVKIDCGVLAVPENRATTNPPTARIAVARLRATGPHPAPDPLLYLEGGPGGSALAEFDLWTDPVSPLLVDRDVILVDPRGAGYSTPRLTCDPEFNDPDNDFGANEELTRRCHDRLAATGIDLSAYTTEQTALDFVDLRHALGYEQWNLMGVSYGTRLALEVLHRDPGGVRAVVLDSAYPAGIASLDTQPTNAYRALRAVLEDCRADGPCSTAFPDLEPRLLKTITDLNARPGSLVDLAGEPGSPGPATYDGGELVRDLFGALYVTAQAPAIPLAIDAATRGSIQQAHDLLTSPPPPTIDSQNRHPTIDEPARGNSPAPSRDPPSDTDGLFLNIECAEDAPLSRSGALETASLAIPTAIGVPLIEDVRDELALCRSWPVSARTLEPATSATPTLVLAGSYDPITPPAWGHVAAETLSRSRVVELAGVGHGVIDAGDCPVQLITTFLADPAKVTAPGSPTCTRRPTTFRTS